MTGVQTPLDEELARQLLDLGRRMNNIERLALLGANPNPGVPEVYTNGTLQSAPIIASGAVNIVSTGAASTYTINYGVTFVSADVVAFAGVDQTNGNAVIVGIVSLGTTNFGIYMIELIPTGSQAVPSGHQVTISWVAAGH